jgi:hypothetical protein
MFSRVFNNKQTVRVLRMCAIHGGHVRYVNHFTIGRFEVIGTIVSEELALTIFRVIIPPYREFA